jgi:hypothetical protein
VNRLVLTVSDTRLVWSPLSSLARALDTRVCTWRSFVVLLFANWLSGMLTLNAGFAAGAHIPRKRASRCPALPEEDQRSDPADRALEELDRLSLRLRELETQRHTFLHRFRHDCANLVDSWILSLLQEPQCGELNARQRGYAQCAEKSTQSLLMLIERASTMHSIPGMQVAVTWQAGNAEASPNQIGIRYPA